jgi:hypothetical protein
MLLPNILKIPTRGSVLASRALWRALPQDQKWRYQNRAKKIDTEHKRQYPDYVYSRTWHA